MTALSTPPSDRVVWEAALGRRVVLVEARTWFEARDKARTMLGGEPEHVIDFCPGRDMKPLFFFDHLTAWPDRRSFYTRQSLYEHGWIRPASE